MPFSNISRAIYRLGGFGLASFCLAAALAGAAAAQAPASGGPSGPSLDPERVALARQIYDQIGAANLRSMSKAIVSTMQSAMTKSVSGPNAQRQQAMLDSVSDSINFILPKAIDATVDAMAQDFDTPELKDILAFYTSPTGRIMIGKMPQIMQHATTTMMADMPEAIRQLELRYCAKVTCTTAKHQAFAAISAQMRSRAPS